MSTRTIAGIAVALVLAILGFGVAVGLVYATPAEPATTVTVDGSDYPVCTFEDCSDQTGQVGVWFDPGTGAAWLSVGDHSVPIDQTADPAAWDMGAYVGGWN